MALGTLIDLVRIKQLARVDAAKSPGVAKALRSLYEHLENGQKQLFWKAFTTSGAVDVVLSDSPCRIYALMVKKRTGSTTASWLKMSDHATVAAANGDIVIPFTASSLATKAFCPVWHDGLPLAIGLTIAQHTTINGATDSAAADSVDGFVLLGAP